MSRDQHPAAWLFHQNTVRWPFNTIPPGDDEWVEAPFKEYGDVPSIPLPAMRGLQLSLRDAIHRRLSCRNFTTSALALDELSTLLGFGYGISGIVHLGAREHLERPVPSGGGLYPLELYVIARHVDGLPPGLYHYAALTHSLEELKRVELSAGVISQLFMNQPYVGDAAVIVLMTAILLRSMHKYGERGYRYILLEAGHAAQNMCLAAVGLDLGALPVGGFFDGYLAELVGLDMEQEPIVYALAIGNTAGANRAEARNVGAALEE